MAYRPSKVWRYMTSLGRYGKLVALLMTFPYQTCRRWFCKIWQNVENVITFCNIV